MHFLLTTLSGLIQTQMVMVTIGKTQHGMKHTLHGESVNGLNRQVLPMLVHSSREPHLQIATVVLILMGIVIQTGMKIGQFTMVRMLFL